MRGLLVCLLLLLSAGLHAQRLDFKSGHVKGQYLLGTYPDDSLLRDFIDTPSQDVNLDLRLLVDGRKKSWPHSTTGARRLTISMPVSPLEKRTAAANPATPAPIM